MSVTGRAIILREGDDESPFKVLLEGRQLRVPVTLSDLLHRDARLTAFFTPWSRMLVNLIPAEDERSESWD